MIKSYKRGRAASTTGLACLILFAAASTSAQTSPKRASFEVASIKPAEPITPAAIASGKFRIGMSVNGARVDIGYLSLADLIPIAFKVRPYQISGPDWMREQRFDIRALLPDGAARDQVPEMLQALLEERFQLKTHRETRDHAVYALLVARGGPKLNEAPAGAETPPEPAPGAITLGAAGNQVRLEAGRGGATVVSPQTGTTRISPGPDGQTRLEMSKMTMPAFAEMLTRFLDRPVVDMTELKSTYQIALDLSMDVVLNLARTAGVGVPALGARGEAGRPADATDPSGSSIFSSLQQMGLRLESRKAPVEFIVIDHVEKLPTEN